MGRVHAAAYRRLELVQVVAVVDPGEAGRGLAAELGVPHFDTLAAAMTACPADIVDVCVPTFLHEACAVAALEASHAVLCEKPVALTEAAAARMSEAAQRSGRQLMVGQTLRFWPEYEVVRDVLRSGTLGDVRLATAVRLVQLPTGSAWYGDPALSGGGALELHVHDVDVLVSLFGRVREVYAVGWKSPRGAWNHVVSSLVFESGHRASVEGGMEMPPGYASAMGLRLVGSEATVEFQTRAGATLVDREDVSSSLWLYTPDAAPQALAVPEGDAYEREVEYFVERVRRGEPTDAVPLAESLHVLDVMLAIRRSLESGETQRL